MNLSTIVLLVVLLFTGARDLRAQEQTAGELSRRLLQSIFEIPETEHYPVFMREQIVYLEGAISSDKAVVEFVDGFEGQPGCQNFITTRLREGIPVMTIFSEVLKKGFYDRTQNEIETKLWLAWGLTYEITFLREFPASGTLVENEKLDSYGEEHTKISAEMALRVTRPLLDLGYEVPKPLLSPLYTVESSCPDYLTTKKCPDLEIQLRNYFLNRQTRYND